MRATRPGTLSAGSRSVGDVLAGERVLVHLGAHVAGVDDEHPTRRLLDREDPARVLERGLRRAVPAPPRVRLDRGVGRDVHDRSRRRPAPARASAAARRARPRSSSKMSRRTSGPMRSSVGNGLAPSVLALFTTSRDGAERRARHRRARARCASSVTSPATPTTSVTRREPGDRVVEPIGPAGVDHERPARGRPAPRRARARVPARLR